MLRFSSLVLIIIAVSACDVSAFPDQIAADLDFILSHRTEDTLSIPHQRPTAQSVSELHLMATGLIKLYQVILSSQDVPTCNFTPSCSRFTMDAIRRGGFIRGTLLGADRLMRCHWFSRPQCHGTGPLDRNSVKIYDPIDWYIHR